MNVGAAFERRWFLRAALITIGSQSFSRGSAQPTLCAQYIDGVMNSCNDGRDPGGQIDTSNPRASPTPWNTWNDPALRNLDADLLRWRTVTGTTVQQVNDLIAQLKGPNGNATNFESLQSNLSALLKNMAGAYIVPPPPPSPEIGRFWQAIGSARDGIDKLKAVNRSFVNSSVAGTPINHLDQFVNSNGLLKGTRFQSAIATLPQATTNRVRSALLSANTNTLLLADAALVDLRMAGGVPDEPYSTALLNNSVNIVSSMVLVTAAFPLATISPAILLASTETSSPLVLFFRGAAGGFAKAASDTVSAIASAIRHPVEVARGIAAALSDVPSLVGAIKNALKNDWETLRNGSAQERGVLLGRISFDVLTIELGAEAVKGLRPVAGLGASALRVSTDQFVIITYVKSVVGSIPAIPSPLAFIADSMAAGFGALWKYNFDSDSILTYVRAMEIQFDELLAIKLLPDGSLPAAAQLLKDSLKDIFADQDALVAMIGSSVDPKTGIVIGLSNAKALVDRLFAIAVSSGDEEAYVASHYLDERYAKAFEESLRLRLEATEQTIGGRQIDAVTDEYIIQASVNTFDRTPTAVQDFMSNKRRAAQIEATVKIAKDTGRESVYYFRRKPPDEIVRYLTDHGINHVWWDL